MTGRRQARALGLVLLVFGVVRLFRPGPGCVEPPRAPEAVAVARSVALEGRFADPFGALKTGTTAHVSPGYPLLIGGFLRVTGTGLLGCVSFHLAAILAMSAALALLPLLAFEMDLGAWPGFAGGFCGLAAGLSPVPNWEASYTAFFAVLVTIQMARAYREVSPRAGRCLGLGALAGVLALFSPPAFAVVAVLIAGEAWRRRSGRLGWPVILLALAPVAMVSPWVVRNFLVFERVIPFRTNLGLELQVSNNDCAQAGLAQNLDSGCFAQFHPSRNAEETQRLRELGEPRYNEEKLRSALQWIAGHPSQFAGLTATRVIAFWFPRERAGVLEEVTVRGRRMERICIYSTTLLSVAGLILLWRRRMRAQFLCLGGWLALFPLIYYAVQYEDRYRSPIMWVTLLLAGLALAALWERLAARPAAASDRTGVSRRNLLLAGGWQDVIFTTGVKVVNVLANVTRKGELVRELTKEDFVLLENGRPQVIRYFSRETDLPLTLGLLVDTSLSQGRVMEAERAASFRFFDQVLRESKDKVFVMQFETGVFLAQKLTSSRKQLDEALSHVDTPSRRELQMQSWSGTRLYDAVVKASREIMAGQKDRKALILLTDGVDVGSDATLAQAIDAALRADTLVYAILFSDTGFFNGGADGRGVLERLARETGGDFFEVTKKKSIDQVYEQIQAELRSQYSLGYVSDVPVEYSEFRKIRLTTRQKGLAVRARDRYWAQR